MGDDGLRYIVANLTKTCLRVLSLNYCGITDGVIELAEVLPHTHIICLMQGCQHSQLKYPVLIMKYPKFSPLKYPEKS